MRDQFEDRVRPLTFAAFLVTRIVFKKHIGERTASVLPVESQWQSGGCCGRQYSLTKVTKSSGNTSPERHIETSRALVASAKKARHVGLALPLP